MSRMFARGSLGALAVVLAAFGCTRVRDGGAPAPASHQPGSSATGAQRDSAPASEAPPIANGAAAARDFIGPPVKLRGFRCTRPPHPTKSPEGPLTLHFVATSPTDFTFHLEFHCLFNCRPCSSGCDYSADLRAEGGVLRDGFPGLHVRCTQSPEEPFAVSCGPLIGSDVEIVVTAQSTSRLVRFTLPPTFDLGIPDLPSDGGASCACLPFVKYDRTEGAPTRKSIDLNYLQFPPEACKLDP